MFIDGDLQSARSNGWRESGSESDPDEGDLRNGAVKLIYVEID